MHQKIRIDIYNPQSTDHRRLLDCQICVCLSEKNSTPWQKSKTKLFAETVVGYVTNEDIEESILRCGFNIEAAGFNYYGTKHQQLTHDLAQENALHDKRLVYQLMYLTSKLRREPEVLARYRSFLTEYSNLTQLPPAYRFLEIVCKFISGELPEFGEVTDKNWGRVRNEILNRLKYDWWASKKIKSEQQGEGQ